MLQGGQISYLKFHFPCFSSGIKQSMIDNCSFLPPQMYLEYLDTDEMRGKVENSEWNANVTPSIETEPTQLHFSPLFDYKVSVHFPKCRTTNVPSAQWAPTCTVQLIQDSKHTHISLESDRSTVHADLWGLFSGPIINAPPTRVIFSAMSLLVVQASLTEVNIRQKKKITLTIFTPAISTESCWYLTPMMRWSLCEIVDKQNQTRAMVLINIQFLFRFGMKRKLWMIFDICHKTDRLFLANKFYVITVFRRLPSEDGI